MNMPYAPGTGTAKPAGPAGDAVGKFCAICQTSIIAGEATVACAHCELPFHEECWEVNRGCSTYGCEAAPEQSKVEQQVALVANVWGEEKVCPNPDCGKVIKANALKCRFCGATFSTRDHITAEEYVGREYEGEEYTAARNKCIALFLLCALACLAPLGLIFTGILVFARGNFLGIDYKRLPLALRTVLICGFGTSCLLTFVMIVLVAFD